MVLRHCSDQPFSLETIFESLIDSFIENKVGLADHFLSVSLAAQLKEKLMSLYASQQMQSAGIGNNALLLHDKLVRSDVIYWLDPAHDDPYENLFFELMDGFIRHLNSTCYTGITGYEFHYALY
ncbi:MAG: hypothetical protein RIQ78_1555, partial [Bacteroidota bacterium]